MNNYTNAEMADMHFMYGRANGNSLEARRLYAEMYPQRVIPHHTIFARLHQRLCERGTFQKRKTDCGRPRVIRTVALEEEVLNMIEDRPELSTRQIANTLNVCNKLIWKILKDHQLYPYHIQRVQALLPRDFPHRVHFCQWSLQMITQNAQFLENVLFTDESNFSRQGITNFHNNHLWAEDNPHAIQEGRYQYEFSLNVWVGIIGENVIGPYFLPLRLNGASYTNFLQEQLPILLENVPLAIRPRMWFMHDGAPAHFSITARQYLDDVYPNRWIGRAGPQPWPPRSPDLNPLDFCIWGHLKSLVYTTPIECVNDLRNRIIAGCETIQNTPGIFQRLRQSMRRRLDSCLMVGGGHFEQFL